MKKIILFILIVAGILGCENQPIEFDDFDYTAVYFPSQFPLRTLSLGEDRIDNSLDREHKFHIGVAIGGMYENKKDWIVEYELDNSLAEGIKTDEGDTIMALPSEYYVNIDPVDVVTIPKGEFSGLIQFELADDFFTDPYSYGNHYVVPLRITAAESDSILTGLPAVSNADKRIMAEWDANAPPKDFVLFMIKYVNEYHGSYLRRGTRYTLDGPGGAVVDTLVYREPYIIDDQIVSLQTSGRNVVDANFTGISVGQGFAMKLTMDPSTFNITIDSIPGTTFGPYDTGGSNSFVKGDQEWGGKPRDAVYLNYGYINYKESQHFEVFDTLVFRDRGIHFEEFLPVKAGEE